LRSAVRSDGAKLPGRGVLFCVNEAIKRFNLTPEQTSVVVQGSGNVGGIGAQLMYEQGYKVTAISDVGGGIYNENGLISRKC
jgi:glutamate dehydrogenase/leucine dehydrogenase